MQLVMLETNGNQRFIFASPRLRDNIGASWLLTRLEDWTSRALLRTGAASAWCAARGLPADAHDPDAPDESQWVSRSSGKVIFLVDSAQQAKDVIGSVTRTALAQAPGMDVSGVFISLPTLSDPQSGPVHVTDDALKEVHAQAARYALQRPAAEARFSQVPFLARAKDSALPASPRLGCQDEANDDQRESLSLPSRVRRYRAYMARMSLLDVATDRSESLDEDHEKLTRDPTKLADRLRRSFAAGVTRGEDTGSDSTAAQQAEADVRRLENAIQSNPDADDAAHLATDTGDFAYLSKVAVIHIDGNGVGGIMRDLHAAKERIPEGEFAKEIGCERDSHDALRRFLLKVNEHLEEAVACAFAAAWTRIEQLSSHDDRRAGRKHTVIPVVPVILGGDDVTAITSGDYALPFAAAYLRYYEEATASDPILKYLTPLEGQESGPMTAAAGVAIIKRNFPFHIGYELAEKLVERAKRVGKTTRPACSTLDYHVLFDTTVLDASEVLRGYKDFTTRPFRLLGDDAASARCNCETCRSDDAPTDPPKHDPPHASWDRTCQRVCRIVDGADESKTDVPPFPRTRAARIRGLLAAGRGQAAADEWTVARTEVGDWIDKEVGGVNTLFDLMELADLLPPSSFALCLPALGAVINTDLETTA